ncbi:sigma-70 family RNA polymerase sigma factor [Acidobacterium sp. S8]|uniref:sigma-70 family RNA polymerase sigma factor n=1 Tax=Acidobacterium sp. S8 TaxID=1641854 RepID=UPI00131AE6F4|nr:sigma-70 family RNA polymerase sigma factor [Acidobacterium sp. S8]
MSFNARGLFDPNTPRIVATQAEERLMEDVQRDIYDSHRHRIFSLSYYMTGNELEAEQLLEDCFVRAFRSDPKPDAGVIDDSLIAELRSSFPLTPGPSAKISNLDSVTGRNVRRTDLEEALLQLPPTERLLYLLREVEGYSPDAISHLVDIPQSETVRVLFSARIRLRGILAEIEARRAAA